MDRVAVITWASKYKDHPSFYDQDQQILSTETAKRPQLANNNHYTHRILKKQEEIDLFIKYNYLKYLISQGNLNYLDEALELRNIICLYNLRLLPSIVNKCKMDRTYDEVLSDAHISLLKSVDAFDIKLGFRFNTYVTASVVQNSIRYKQRTKPFPYQIDDVDILYEPDLDRMVDNSLLSERITKLIGYLTPREAELIKHKFGLGDYIEKSLVDIAEMMNLTRERIRQLHDRALIRLRLLMSMDKI